MISRDKKILLILLFVFIASYGVLLYAFHRKTRDYAIVEAEKKVENLLLNQRALHTYVEDIQKPIIYKLKQEGKLYHEFFSPEVLSFTFMARNIQAFYNTERAKEGLPPLHYKLASDNPRNPLNQAEGFELDLLRRFNEEQLSKYTDIVARDGNLFLYYALPVNKTKLSCLRCHGDPADAPGELVKEYGPVNGFNEHSGRVRAIISIFAPMEEELLNASRIFKILSVVTLFVLGFIFSLVGFFINKLSIKNEMIAMRNVKLEHLSNDLEKQKKHLSLAQQATQICSYEYNFKFNSYLWSDTALALFGLHKDHIPGSHDQLLAHVEPEDLERVRKTWQKIIADKRSFRIEYCLVRPDGRTRYIREEARTIFEDGEPQYILGTVHDVTDKRKQEQEILRLQKLESLRILSGGIAHDYNNLLTAILGNLSIAQAKINGQSIVQKLLQAAEKASLKASDLTRQLMSVSHAELPEKKVVSLEKIIKETANAAIVQDDMVLEYNIHRPLSAVEVDEAQIRQVFYNIFVNAREAMGEKRAVRVNATDVVPSSKDMMTLAPGRYVKVSIADEGQGIPEQNLGRLFDPYFTTKEMGSKKGQGLGLTICFTIVKNHGGTIRVDSVLGKGTSVHVLLPASEKKITHRCTERYRRGVDGRGRILFMDDEKSVRLTVENIIKHLGHEVETCRNGEDVLDIINEKGAGYFDVIILDMVIEHGMGGVDTARELRSIDPELYVVLSTGYFDDPVMEEYEKYGFNNVLVKPFSVDNIRSLLIDALHTAS